MSAHLNTGALRGTAEIHLRDAQALLDQASAALRNAAQRLRRVAAAEPPLFDLPHAELVDLQALGVAGMASRIANSLRIVTSEQGTLCECCHGRGYLVTLLAGPESRKSCDHCQGKGRL